jgi:3-phenylpropionate/trans-cinnamate dioxygenase ferredoxin component
MSAPTVQFRTLGAAATLPSEWVNPYYLDDVKRRVSVARVAGALYAFDDLCTCPAQPCPLSAGLLDGITLMCQCHGSVYDLTTGQVLRGPATKRLPTYEVRERDGQIQVRV